MKKFWGLLVLCLLMPAWSVAERPALPMQNAAPDSGESIPIQTQSSPGTVLYFPDYVEGGGWSVQLVLGNLDPARSADPVEVQVYNQEGRTVSRFFDSRSPVEIPALGSRVLRSTGGTQIRRGWIRVRSPIASVRGLLTYRHVQSGIEVGVEPVSLGGHFALFVEETTDIGTGVAIFKPEASPEIEFQLRDEAGLDPMGQVLTHGDFRQRALTLPEWLSGVDQGFLRDFRGLLFLRAEDDSSFAPLGLRFGKRQGSLSAVPVIPATLSLNGDAGAPPNPFDFPTPGGGPDALYFPDYVEGGGWSVRLVLGNLDPARSVEVEVEVSDQAGQAVSGFFDSRSPVEIPALGSRVLKSTGGAQIRRGWIRVRSPIASVRGLLTYRHVQSGIEVGVEPVPLGDHFALFVEETTDIGTGVAIFKPEADSRIELQVRNEAGRDPIGEVLVHGDFRQQALTVPQWLSGVDQGFLRDFRGLLFLQADDDSSFAPIGLRFGKRQGSLSAVPVIPILDDGSGAGKMYWTDAGTDKIQRSNLDGSGVEDLVSSGLSAPGGLALDVGNGKMYWTDVRLSRPHVIQRSNLDGSGVEDLVSSGLSGPNGLALDVGAGKMYWTDNGTQRHRDGKIQRSNLDGSGVEDLVSSGLVHPAGLALDLGAGKMYWTDQGTDKIQRADLDGSGVEDLVFSDLIAAGGLALDLDAGKMYWTDAGTSKIQRANLDGSGVEDLVSSGLGYPHGLALDLGAGKMYWTDTRTAKIQRSNLDGSGVEDLVSSGLAYPARVALDLDNQGGVGRGTPSPPPTVKLSASPRSIQRGQSATLTWSSTHAVSATITPGIGSVPVSGSRSVSPVSTTTYRVTVRDASGRTASASVTITVTEPPSDLVVTSPSVSVSTLTTGQSFDLMATVRNQGTGRAAATTLRYYRSSDATITTDDTSVGTDAVSALDASGTSDESISLTAPSSAGTYYYGACVDSVSGESRTGNNCSQSVRVTVSEEGPTGTSRAGKMYWTDYGTDKIQRANLDGSEVEDLVTSGLNIPAGLALDLDNGKMYWTDSGTAKIQRANLDGTGVEDLITSGLSRPEGLALDVDAGKMYWTDRGTDKIQRANLNGSGVEDLVTSGLVAPFGLALDLDNGKMYWTDWGTDKIQRANLNGSGVEDLVTGLSNPRGLALDLDNGKMYWSDLGTDTIQRANLNGSGVEDLVISGLDEPVSLALDQGSLGRSTPSTPPTVKLAASPGSIQRGQSATLTWSSTHAVNAEITPDIGSVPISGSRSVSPVSTTTYRITVRNLRGQTATATATVTVTAPPPDLVVDSPSVSASTLTTGQAFDLRTTVRNQGAGRAGATTLRYYQSSDATITTGDTSVGTDAVSALEASGTSDESISLTAPSSAGTYYYGACVDSVSGESRTDNNCSAGVQVTVTAPPPTVRLSVSPASIERGRSATLTWSSTHAVSATITPGIGSVPVSGSRSVSPVSTTTYRITVRDASGRTASASVTITVTEPPSDLVVTSPSVSASTLTTGQSFDLRATVRNQGTGRAGATTLRYYRSGDATITTEDTSVGTDAVSALEASGTSDESISLTAPSSAGTYYYGACVDSVSGESRTGNNCSQSVRVTVSEGARGSSGGAKMYWTDETTGKIQRANLNGSGAEDLVTGLSNPRGLALDLDNGKMYWSDLGTDTIQRANLNGSGVEDLVTSGVSGPEGLALNVAAGKMYWTDSATRKIQRANLDGTGVEDLVTGLGGPYGLALDLNAGKMYWTETDTDKIRRANLDGTGVEDLVTSGLAIPVGLALDLGAGKMYWTDFGTDKIQRANLDGRRVEDLVTSGLTIPVGLALDLDVDKMYWTDAGTRKIQRANLNGSGVEDLVTGVTGLGGPYGLALDLRTRDTRTPTLTCNAVANPTANPGLVSDCRVLLGLRDQLAGTASLNWDGDRIIDDWQGVVVSGDPLRVSQLDLTDNELTGEIPAELAQLSQLRTLNLTYNELTGEIPVELAQLSRLGTLDLAGNALTGEIPVQLGQLSQLTRLSLQSNALTGEIPMELAQLSRLLELSLSRNALRGEIPVELGQLSQLGSLFLNNNALTGEIPVELGQLSRLGTLSLYNNALTGEIPEELGQLSRLSRLHLEGNGLTGEIPVELGELSRLHTLRLWGNELAGEIPVELAQLSQLRWLFLDWNRLTGEIPVELAQLSQLEALHLDNNALTGEIPVELGQLSQLRSLHLQHNRLTGSIPAELGQLSNLNQFSYRGNSLTGPVPSELRQLPYVYVRHLTALRVNSQLQVSWDDPVDSTARYNYMLEDATGTRTDWTPIAPLALMAGEGVRIEWTLMDLPADVSYRYIIVSVSGSGDSAVELADIRTDSP